VCFRDLEGVCECSCFESENLIETRRAGLINTLKGFAIGDNYKTERERAKRLADGCLLFIPLSAQSTASGAFLCMFTAMRIVPRSPCLTANYHLCLHSKSSRCATNSWVYICSQSWRFVAHRKQKGKFGPDELICYANLPPQNK
jgi:hypothetical protein